MVQSIRQLDALRDEWDALSVRFETPLLDHDWFVSCAETLHRDGDLRVITVRQDGGLAAAAPLVREAGGGGRLVLLGSSALYEPSGVIYGSGDAVAELTDRLIATGRPLLLQRLDSQASLLDALARVPRAQAVSLVRRAAESLAVTTTGDWNAYYAGLSSQVTTNLRRLRRKVEKTFGPIELECSLPAVDEVDAALESFAAVEASGWKGRQRSSLNHRPQLRAFFRAYGMRAARRGTLRFVTLRFGGTIAACELAVEVYRRWWQLKIGYQDALSAYYPGLHLTEYSIRGAFERGLRAYEFLGSAADWERRWSPAVRTYCTAAVYPVSPRGVLSAARETAVRAWRLVSRVGPPLLRDGGR